MRRAAAIIAIVTLCACGDARRADDGFDFPVGARDGQVEREIEALYAHLDRIDVAAGAVVARGQQIGTIGTAGGQYLAHLHFELRTVIGRPLGGGYGVPDGQIDPAAFIAAHRPRR